MIRARLLTPFLLAFAALAASGATLPEALAEVDRLQQSGQAEAALAAADAWLANAPRSAQMRFRKAGLLADRGRRDEAAALLEGLIADYPEVPEPYNNLAALHAARGEYAQARAALEEALRINPGYAAARENLGDVHAALARQAYARALQLDPASATLPPKLAALRAGALAPAPARPTSP